MQEFENKFESKIKIISYARNIKTKKIVQLTFIIEGRGITDMDGNYLPAIQKSYTVELDDKVIPNTDVKQSEITKDLFHYWLELAVPKEVMDEYKKELYFIMYPEIEFFTPNFSY